MSRREARAGAAREDDAVRMRGDEALRLEALRRYGVLEGEREEAFDRIVRLAARLFAVPIALINFVDEERVQCRASYGLAVDTLEREIAFCSHTIQSDEPLVVPDAAEDPRFAESPLVRGEHGLRFYAGTPLSTPEGVKLGTLCVLDTRPRDGLSGHEQQMLRDLGAMLEDELELRFQSRERDRLHREVAQQRDQLKAILDGVADGITAQDRSGRLLYANISAANTNGYPFLEVMLSAPTDELERRFELLDASGEPFPFERLPGRLALAGIESPPVTLCFRDRQSGETRWSSVQATPMFDEAGEVAMAINIMHDLSEHKNAEAALRESESRYRAIFETAAVSMWEEDFSEVKGMLDALREQGVADFRTYFAGRPEVVHKAIGLVNILDANQETVRMLGATSKAELLGSLEQIFVAETLDTFVEELVAIAEGQRYFAGETVIRTLGGEPRNALITMTLPVVTGSFGRVLVSIMDITDRKRAEEAVRRSEEEARRRELEEILAAHSSREKRRLARELHDGIRQQLVGIRMLAANLHKKLAARALPEAGLMEEFARLVGDANTQVRELIHDLAPRQVEADGLLPALERSARNLEQWYGVACTVTFGKGIRPRNDETANHLFHIAQEAMTNAAKHSKATRIDVDMRLDDELLKLEVSDDGLGLPDDYEKRGGMGLANMHYRAELIGGRLEIKTGTEEGTVVRCWLKGQGAAVDADSPASKAGTP